MIDKGRLSAVSALALGLLVFSFAWSTALYIMLGFSIDAVRPWSVYQYIAAYGVSGDDAKLLTTAFLIATIAGSVAAGALWVFRAKTYYGDARWAYAGEVRHAHLLDDDGILVGKRGQQYLRNGEPGHVLVAAPTRSGKGVGIVIPNLLSWPGSVVVLDIKHENHALTSGFRSQHQRVFKWSPADDDGHSHCFNPLAAVRSDPGHRISDLQRLATMLLPQPAHADPMWQNEARDLFIGLALFVMDDPAVPSTLGEIYRTLKSEHDLSVVIQWALDRQRLDPSCRMSLANYLNKAPKERSGVKSNLTSALNLWANPVIDAATASSDFDLADLRRRPTSIYVGVKRNQLTTLAPLIGLFFQQCVDILGRDLPGPDEPHQVLLMIDEFASLGRLDVIENAMAFLAGYRIRLVIIIQGLGQLDHLYGQGRENILQNSAVQVFFAANDETTAKYVSNHLGTKTIQTASRSDPGGFRWATKTTGHSGRDLMLPEQVRQLKDTKEIVFKEGARPIKANKIRYYRDKAFKRRILPPASVPRLKLKPIGPRNFDTAALVSTDVPTEGAPVSADRAPQPESTTVTEIEAMGREIAQLMADEHTTSADQARDELNAALDLSLDR